MGYHMTKVGTLIYMAPEVIKKEKNHIRLVCKKNGFRPKFFVDSNNDRFVPPEIQKVIQCSWEHDISKRYSISKAYNELARYYGNNFQNQKNLPCSAKQNSQKQSMITNSQRSCKSFVLTKKKGVIKQNPLIKFSNRARNTLIRGLAKKEVKQEEYQELSITLPCLSSIYDCQSNNIQEHTSTINV